MASSALTKHARMANVAVVVGLDAIQKGQWEEAERAFAELVLLASNLRRQLHSKTIDQARTADIRSELLSLAVLEPLDPRPSRLHAVS